MAIGQTGNLAIRQSGNSIPLIAELPECPIASPEG